MTRVARPVAAVMGALLVLLPLAFVRQASSQSDGEGSNVVREVVVSVLDSEGGVRSTRVAQLVRLDGDGQSTSVTVPDLPGLEGYRNVSGFSRPVRADGDLEWRSTGNKDTLALADVEKELPLEVRASYFLDNEEVSPADLRGQSGAVRIELELTNVSDETRTLTHPAVSVPSQTNPVRVYVPLEFSVLADFPTKTWRRVSAEDAYFQTNDRGDEVLVRPGVLNPPVGPDREIVVIEAQGDNIILPDIRIAAFPRVAPQALEGYDEQLRGLKGLHGGLTTINATFNTIYEGTLQIIDGLEALLGGVGERDPSTGNPVINLDATGTPDTVLGALGFIRNAMRDQMLTGIGARGPDGKPVVTLGADGVPTTAIGALGFIEDAIRAQILPRLGVRDPVTGKAVVNVDEKGRPETLLWGLQSAANSFDDTLIPGIDEVINGIDAMIAGLHTRNAAEPGLVDGLELLRDGLGSLIENLDQQNPNFMIDCFAQVRCGMREALSAIQLLAEDGTATGDGRFNVINVFSLALLEGLGQRNPDGSPEIEIDPETGLPTTVIGGLGFMQDAIGNRMLPGIGRNDASGRPIIRLDADGTPTTLLGALGFIRGAALTNPEFERPQASLGGVVPKDYFQDCPFCWDSTHPMFDPRTADPRIQPAFREAFEMFSEGLNGAVAQLHTLDDDNPGLIEGLNQIADGVQSLYSALHTQNANDPGLVDGIEQVVDGLNTLMSKLHTFNQDDPGVVDGLELVRGGVQQVSQGIFAVNELGIRTARGTVGEAADEIARDSAVLEEQQKDLQDHAFLAAGADEAFTSYVFEIPGQATTLRDNAVRGALIAIGALGVTALGRRPRLAWRRE